MRILTIVLAFLLGGAPLQGPRAEETTFTFENVEIQTVIRSISDFTGFTFLFDPEEVKGRITLLSPKRVSPQEALQLLESALALLDYRLLEKQEGVWIVIPDPSAAVSAAFYTMQRVPYYRYSPANSLIPWWE